MNVSSEVRMLMGTGNAKQSEDNAVLKQNNEQLKPLEGPHTLASTENLDNTISTSMSINARDKEEINNEEKENNENNGKIAQYSINNDIQIRYTEHNTKINQMFSSIHKRYDLLNHLLSLGVDYWWRHCLVNEITLGQSNKVLDMAAGTLDVSLAIAKKYPEAQIIAGDICEKMLGFGKEKINAHKNQEILNKQITTQVMDAQEIPLENKSIDVCTIAFGIRNVENRVKAIQEMQRVLRVGGQLCILEFAPVSVPFVGKLYYFYLEKIMPKLAKLIVGDASSFTYLSQSIEAFPKPVDFVKTIKEAGFSFVKYEKLTFGLVTLYTAIKSE